MRIENLITTRCFRQYAWSCKLDSKFSILYDKLVMSLKITCWIWCNKTVSEGTDSLEDISKLDRYQNHINIHPDSYAPVFGKFTFFTFRNTHTLRLMDVWLQNLGPEIHLNLHLVHSNSCSPSRIFTAPDRITVPLRVRRQPTSLTRIRPILGLVSAS